MSITVKYFASLRESLGTAEERIDAGNLQTVAELLALTRAAGKLPANTLIAVNQSYSNFDTAIKSGDEVAFFPPVTGG